MSERVSYIELYSPKVSRISKIHLGRDSKQLINLQQINTESQQQQQPLIEEEPHEPSSELLRSNFFKLQFMTWCYVLLFTAFTPVYNLSTQLYQQLGYSNLGMIVLFTNAVCFGLSSVIATNLVSKYSLKIIMFFSCTGYSLFVMSGIFIAYCSDHPDSGVFYCKKGFIPGLAIFGAITSGLCGGHIWLANAAYIDALASTAPSYRGRYYGTFIGTYQFSSLIGITISCFVLKYFTKLQFFLLMSCISCGAQALFLFLPYVKKVTKNESRYSQLVQDISYAETIRKFFAIFQIPELKYFFPFMLMNGISIELFAGFMHKNVERALIFGQGIADESTISSKTTLVFFVLAISEIAGGYLMGKIADVYENATFLLTQITINIGLLALFFLIATYYLESYAMCFICVILLGLVENFVACLVSVIITDDYGGKFEVFCLFRVSYGLANSAFLTIQLLIAGYSAAVFLFIVLFVVLLINTINFKMKKPEMDAQTIQNL